MPPLKLIALDAEDLGVVSAHLQDAVLRVGDIGYQPKERRFAAIVNRFDWLHEGVRRTKGHQRRRTAVRFEHVTSVQRNAIGQGSPDAVLSLMTVEFRETVAPSGVITLIFAGGGAIKLSVECIEAELRDLGAAWSTPNRPDHDKDGGTSGAR
jgi:hypothetical protein